MDDQAFTIRSWIPFIVVTALILLYYVWTGLSDAGVGEAALGKLERGVHGRHVSELPELESERWTCRNSSEGFWYSYRFESPTQSIGRVRKRPASCSIQLHVNRDGFVDDVRAVPDFFIDLTCADAANRIAGRLAPASP